MSCVCVFLGLAPARIKVPNSDRFEESYWEVALSKEVFGNMKLPDLILEFDRGKVTQE